MGRRPTGASDAQRNVVSTLVTARPKMKTALRCNTTNAPAEVCSLLEIDWHENNESHERDASGAGHADTFPYGTMLVMQGRNAVFELL